MQNLERDRNLNMVDSGENEIREVQDIEGITGNEVKCGSKQLNKRALGKKRTPPHHDTSDTPVLLGMTGSRAVTTSKSVGSTDIRVRLNAVILFLRVTAGIFLNLSTQQTPTSARTINQQV